MNREYIIDKAMPRLKRFYYEHQFILIASLLLFIFLVLITLSYSYSSEGGVLAIHGEKELTADILDQENPFVVQESIKECTFLTGKVISFSTETDSVEINITNQPENTYIYAYLPVDQLKALSIGQEVKIRGRFDYSYYGGIDESTYIYIGDSVEFFAFLVKARIIE